MSEFQDAKVKLVVENSKCSLYQVGDEIYINGCLIDAARSSKLCLTALHSIYQFIYAARKRVSPDDMGFTEMIFQCPDVENSVEFRIIQYD